MSIPVFQDMRLERPTYEQIKAAYDELNTALDNAVTAGELKDVIERWDHLGQNYGSWSSLTHLHFNQDTKNPEYKAAREYADELGPRLSDLDSAFKRKLIKHPQRPALDTEFGPQAFAKWDFDARSFDPAIEADSVKENKLGAEYTELLASARFTIGGEVCTLSTLGPHLQSTDRAHRKEAQRLRWQWFKDNAAQLDRLYDDLVKLRHGMATKLGLRDYVELGYLNMHRIDYNRADVEAFRKQIRDDVVPLAAELKKRQAAKLGLDALMFWDDPVSDPAGNPKPKGSYEDQVHAAQAMFDAMGHGLGEFFALMNKHNLLDLKSRDTKAGGGFCTSFPVWGVPFIFANFNGTKGDVEVFTHEMGHAYQNYCSQQAQKLGEYHWPTYESAEVHSMSLEFLTWPHMEKFFGEGEAERFRQLHLTESLVFLPYGTAVDHFQHLVYENPNATPDERKAMWQEMERTYLPWRNYGDLPYVEDGGFWQLQRHIYLSPFYYIDYVLAQTCALQFWAKANQDRDAAMKDYAELCKRGGSLPFQGLVKSAGLRSPFEPGCLSDAVDQAKAYLKV